MKTIFTDNTGGTTQKQSNSYIAEARAREQAWRDFRLEIGLVGAQLWRLRQEKGYSIDYVAKAVKMSKTRLAKIEHGMYIHFGVRDLTRLSEFYGTTPVEILSVIPDTVFEDLDEQSLTTMTRLGEYLTKKSVNKAIVARKTGLSKQRMGELTLNEDAKLRAHEVYLIALAIGAEPSELFEYVCEGLELKG